MKIYLKLCLLFLLVLLVYANLSVKADRSPNATFSKLKRAHEPSSQPSNLTIARYRKFINQHVDKKMTAKDCNVEINKRDISEADSNLCKKENTFILATTEHIKPVCGKAGQPYQGHANLRISNQPFPVVNCKSKREGKHLSNCEYRGTVRIVLGCAEGFPVHYDKGVI
ncbi:hypothetical protein ACEWY4_024896 [Coilia grayii]|uniref:Ribonuclease A-domain domain-containing protein n=1 Tax=Coilia grayii TaxID=363190 RepID=A0ABD1IWE6_9TELE